MSYIRVALKTLFISVCSKLIILLDYVLYGYFWKYNTDKCSIFSLIVSICVPTLSVFIIPVLVLTKPNKVSTRVILYYGIMGGLHLASLWMFTSAPFMRAMMEVDNLCKNKTISDDEIRIFPLVLNYLGIFFWICEMIVFLIYIYKYYQFKNNEVEKN
jgi:hypothetical protein